MRSKGAEERASLSKLACISAVHVNRAAERSQGRRDLDVALHETAVVVEQPTRLAARQSRALASRTRTWSSWWSCGSAACCKRSRAPRRLRAGAVPATASASDNLPYERVHTNPAGRAPGTPPWIGGRPSGCCGAAIGPASYEVEIDGEGLVHDQQRGDPLQTKRHHIPRELAQMCPEARLPPVCGQHPQLMITAGSSLGGSASTAVRVMALRSL